MQVIFIALLALAIGTNASILPGEIDFRSDRSVIGRQVNDTIQEFAQSLRANGWDPLQVHQREATVTVQPGIIVTYSMKELLLLGISEIIVSRSEYTVLTSRFRLNLGFPEILFSLVESFGEIDNHGSKNSGALSGDLAIRSLRLEFDLRFNVGVISGISIRSSDVKFIAPTTSSDLKVKIQGEDYTEAVNQFINVDLAILFQQNEAAINRFLSELVLTIGNEILGFF